MRPQTIIIVVLALVFGLSAAVAVNIYISRPPIDEAKKDTKKYVVAKNDLDPGKPIFPGDLKYKEYPKHLAPANGFEKIEQVASEDQPRPRTVKHFILEDEPISSRKVTGFGEGGLSIFVKPGKRAFTVPISANSNGVGGWVKARDRVDILLSIKSTEEDEREYGIDDGGASTVTLMQDVEVMAVGNIINPDTGKRGNKGKDDKGNFSYRHMTVSVSPEEAAMLQLASNQGALSLTLRSPDDEGKKEESIKIATKKELRSSINPDYDESAEKELQDEFEAKLAAMDQKMNSKLEALQKELALALRPRDEETPIQTIGGQPQEVQYAFIIERRGGATTTTAVPLKKANLDQENPMPQE